MKLLINNYINKSMEKDIGNYKAYLYEVSESIIDSAKDAIAKKKKAKKGSEEYHLASGMVLAYYDVLLSFQDYVKTFDLDFKEINLENVNLEKEFLRD